MELKLKRVAGGLVVFVGLAEWLLWLMPPPHRPLEYMIAGTAATVAALGVVFARVVRWRGKWEQSEPPARIGRRKRLPHQAATESQTLD